MHARTASACSRICLTGASLAQEKVHDYISGLLDRWGDWMEDMQGTVDERRQAHTPEAFQRYLDMFRMRNA